MQTKPASAFETGSQGLFKEASGGICQLTGFSSPREHPRKLKQEAPALIPAHGRPGPGGAPKETLRRKLEGGRVGGCPPYTHPGLAFLLKVTSKCDWE